MFEVNNKYTMSMTSFWCLFINFKHISHFFSGMFVANYEQVNVSWENTE